MTQQPERRDLRVCVFISLLVFGLVNAVLAQSDGDIHRVNFQDFIYRPSCASGDAEPQIRTRNGKYEVYNDKEQIGFTVSTPAYGDLTNDGVDEAVILSVCNTGGSGQFSEGFIYTMRGGKPLLLARIPGGDRASGGLHNLTVERGLLVVESYAMKDTSGLCCPDFIDTTRYRWDGRKLVQAGKTIRRTYLTSPRDQESQGRLESEPQPRVAPQSPPLPKTQPFARPESLNPNTTVLPPGFVGADPKSTVEWFSQSLARIPITIDQYSTPAERAKFDQLRAQPFQSLGLLPFTLVEYACQRTYKPETQQFVFTLTRELTSSPAGFFKFTTAKLPVFQEEQPSSTYEASNAFGVRMTITQYYRKEISLAFFTELPDPYNLAPLRDEQKSLSRTKHTFSVPMASSEARMNDKDMRCLALFRPSPPYVYEYEDKRAPTLDGPTREFPWMLATKGTALFGKFEQLWVYHQRSGKIYTKVK